MLSGGSQAAKTYQLGVPGIWRFGGLWQPAATGWGPYKKISLDSLIIQNWMP